MEDLEKRLEQAIKVLHLDGYLKSAEAVFDARATISRLTTENDGMKEMAVHWQTAAVAEMEKCITAERERDALRQVLDAASPFAAHGWYDAELEDDNTQLTRHSGPITVGDWRKLQHAIDFARALATPPDTDANGGPSRGDA